MNNFQKISLFLLRLCLGILFFYGGLIKIINPAPAVDFLNSWIPAIIGLALIFGVFVRIASSLGIILTILYYIPVFPPVPGWIDEHVIYVAAFLTLIAFGAGEILTLNSWIQTRLHPAWHKYFK